jgi:hypothetical protein
MNSKELKKIFNDAAQANDFKEAFGGWYKQSEDCIAILELQKSVYGNLYMLNIKVFLQGSFGKFYFPTKDLIKSSIGDINSGSTKQYASVFDLDDPLADNLRKEKLNELFEKHIVPFTNNTLFLSRIKKLLENGEIKLLPAVQGEFMKLCK